MAARRSSRFSKPRSIPWRTATRTRKAGRRVLNVWPLISRNSEMSNGGLSKARLDRMHDVMAGYVERGEVPGLVTLVSRCGETYVDAIGSAMRRDTIFRISSMTKPIAAAAAMILVEECKLRLDEPVDGLL